MGAPWSKSALRQSVGLGPFLNDICISEPLPRSAFGTDLYYKIHTVYLISSAFPCPLPPSSADVIYGWSLSGKGISFASETAAEESLDKYAMHTSISFEWPVSEDWALSRASQPQVEGFHAVADA